MNKLIEKIKNFILAFFARFRSPAGKLEVRIKELKLEQKESLNGLAELSSIIISTKRSIENNKQSAIDCEKNALLFLQKAKNGELSENEANIFAKNELFKKNEIVKETMKLSAYLNEYNSMNLKIENHIQKIQSQIKTLDMEVSGLKARHKIAKSSAEINKMLSDTNPEPISAMLEDFRAKTQNEEALADTYHDMLYIKDDIDKQIDNALGADYSQDEINALNSIKTEMLTDNINETSNGGRVIDID